MRVTTTFCLISFLSLLSVGSPARVAAQPLPGTKPLDWEGDIASRLAGGVKDQLTRVTRQALSPAFQAPSEQLTTWWGRGVHIAIEGGLLEQGAPEQGG